MTLSAITPLIKYTASAAQTDFPLPCQYYDAADAMAWLVSDAGETALALTVIQTATEAVQPALKTGFVRLAVARDEGDVIMVGVWPAASQDQKYHGIPITARQRERVVDRLAMGDAMQRELIGRSYRVPLSDPVGSGAGKVIGPAIEDHVPKWDADGNLVPGPSVADVEAAAGVAAGRALVYPEAPEDPIYNAGGRKIGNLAVGTLSGDAATFGQLGTETSARILADAAMTVTIDGHTARLLALEEGQGYVIHGLPTDGTTDAIPLLLAALDLVPNYAGVVRVPGRLYAAKSTDQDPSTRWIADGDTAIDTPDDASIMLYNRKGITLDIRGCRFVPDTTGGDGYTFYFYKCIDCEVLGGRGIGNTTLAAGANQASFIIFARCLNCHGFGQTVDRYYRNLFIYRSSGCSFEGFRSTRGGYFNVYVSGTLDINLAAISDDVAPPYPYVSGHNWACNGYAQGGKYANFLGDSSHFFNNSSVNAGRQGVPATHFRNDSGFSWVDDNTIYEGSDQNSGDVVTGMEFAAGSNFATNNIYPTGSRARGNNIYGGRVSIATVGARELKLEDNHCYDFYLTGISAVARVVGGDSYVMDGLVVDNNTVGQLNLLSTLTAGTAEKKAGIQIERLDGAQIVVSCTSNPVNVDNRGSDVPTGTYYETYTNLVGGDAALLRGQGTNLVRGSGTALIT